jgi:hypothetical protein
MEFPFLKPAGKLWQLIMGHHPAPGGCFFYFKLFHISCVATTGRFESALKGKSSGFICIATGFLVGHYFSIWPANCVLRTACCLIKYAVINGKRPKAYEIQSFRRLFSFDIR